MSVQLTEALLRDAAGWEAMKLARALLDQGRVVSSYWAPPLLRGVVQADGSSIRAAMTVQGPVDIDNHCTCRDARQWGKICAHSVAVGLHWLRSHQPAPVPAPPSAPGRPTTPARGEAAAPSRPAPPRRPPSLLRATAGNPAQLRIILPPNFEVAVARGRVMLVLEAEWQGGRSPLNGLPKGRPFCFSSQDNAVIDQLEALAAGETPALVQLALKDLAALLPLLVGHPEVRIGKGTSVTIGADPLPLPLRATLQPDGEIELALPASAASLTLVGDWVWRSFTLRPVALPAGVRTVLQAPVRIPRTRVPQFLGQDWPALAAMGSVEANFTLEDFTLTPHPPTFLLALSGGLARLGALLQCAYGPRIMTLGVTAAGEDVWLPDPDVPTRYATRDLAAERGALSRLQRSGFSGPDAQGRLQLVGQDAVLRFFAREYPALQKAWRVTLDEHLEQRTVPNLERIEPRFEITSSGVQWFDLGVVFAATGGETFSAAEIQRLLRSGQSHTRLRNGRLAVIDTGAVEELQEVLLDCAPQQHAEGYRVAGQQAAFLEATLRQHPGWQVQAPAAWRERAARQSGEAVLECPSLGPLEAVLRPYQKQGVAWLHFLRANQFGGILADEMGLGKTLQALAFLASLRHAPPAPGQPPPLPHLVVCPTSLVFNWAAEARRFVPDLKVLVLHGADRHAQFEALGEHDLAVTSYAVLRRDAARYRGVEFDTLILDEAQHIKNRQTQNAQAVKAVRARQRLVLTGTPMENSVLDLWSIFDFLMPGYLGTAPDFRERYELPIARDRDVAAQARLARRLRPFLLRRLKQEVAADLPARLEQVSYCELTTEQRAVYQQVIEASRREVLEAVDAQGEARSRMVVLTALLRLRQVCCDLRLLNLENVRPATASGKLELFAELLEEALDGGHRVLVFSQFVGMLTLLKERLTDDGIEFCYLDGATTDRGAVVERFQTQPHIPVFLISLKAGGVGLNLTGADTVIHFDPWWNPAVEDQATDRAHRIGQTRVVTSYKLITRDTVEEKILTLQNRKREVIQGTIGDEQSFAASLSWDEIRDLLE